MEFIDPGVEVVEVGREPVREQRHESRGRLVSRTVEYRNGRKISRRRYSYSENT